MFNLQSDIAARVPQNEKFTAVRAQQGMLVLCSAKEVIHVPGDGFALGSKFLNINGVLVKEDQVDSYKSRYQSLQLGRATNGSVSHYGQLKKKRGGKRK